MDYVLVVLKLFVRLLRLHFVPKHKVYRERPSSTRNQRWNNHNNDRATEHADREGSWITAKQRAAAARRGSRGHHHHQPCHDRMIQRSIEEMVAVDASFENTGAGEMGGLGCAVAVIQGPSEADDRGEPVTRVKGHNRAQL
jgi:hypothetical protein